MTAQVVRIEDAASGAAAEVLISLGFNCFSWKTPAEGKQHEQLWAEAGFETGEKRASGSGVPLLFPFPSRIRGGEFEYDGVRHKIEKVDGKGNAIHGFAFDNPWRLINQTSDSVTGEFCPSIDAPHTLGQWTGDYTLTATYRITADQLVLDITAKNTGDSPMPYGFGTHAYFRLPLSETGEAEATIVKAPIDKEWANVDLLPTGDLTPITAKDPSPEGNALADRTFDAAYRLTPGGPTGKTVTELIDPKSGAGIRQTFDESMICCVVYTPPHREAICLEPYTCTPNLFEMQAARHAAGLRELAPGETYETTITLETFDNAGQA